MGLLAFGRWTWWRFIALYDGYLKYPDEDISYLYQRTWLRHGLYPTGISFVVDVPDGDTGSTPKGVCYMADGPDGRRAVSQGGLLYGSMDRTEAGTVPQGGLLYGRWTGLRKPMDICYMHMVIGPDELTKEWGIIPLGV